MTRRPDGAVPSAMNAVPKSRSFTTSVTLPSSPSRRTTRTFSGIDVAVDDAAVVRVLERRTDLSDDPRGARGLEALFLRHQVDEVDPVELLGDQVVHPVRFAPEVEDPEDVRVVHPARGEGLGAEALRDGLRRRTRGASRSPRTLVVGLAD